MSIIITTATDYVFTIIARHFDKCSAYTLPSKPCRAIIIIIPISQMNRLLIYMPVSLGERTTARNQEDGCDQGQFRFEPGSVPGPREGKRVQKNIESGNVHRP